MVAGAIGKRGTKLVAVDEPSNSEGWLSLSLKGVIYVVTVWLFLRTLATDAGLYAGFVAVPLAITFAQLAHRARLRLLASLVFAALSVGLGALLGSWVRGSTGVWGGLEVTTTIELADALQWGFGVLGVVYALRALTNRFHVFAVLEVAVVITAVTYTFSGHRNYAINRPRFFADWALSQGIDPVLMLDRIGLLTSIASVLMLLRRQRPMKLLMTMGALVAAASFLYMCPGTFQPEFEPDSGGLGLTSEEQKDKDKDGKENPGGSAGGSSNNPLNDSFSGGGTPEPVALLLLHKDWEPASGLMYLRQQVLSTYNGVHLSADETGDYDRDVIDEFPRDQPILAESVQNPDLHIGVPTSMFLLADHPQPFALTSSLEVRPLDNPNPTRFVAAYEVTSQVLSVETSRLLGRKSIPPEWTDDMIAHYTGTADDPRYDSLAEELLRDLDPRFIGDDLMKALTLKRYLEVNGFYTRKETYKDVEDPAAAFLFGSMRGYCVHFAHAAVHLFRSQGIAARVAVGYAVDVTKRSGGSAVLVMGDSAHAWPEIHLAGVGWIPFDIYPQDSDEPPPRLVDMNLESILGELARKDESGGKAEDPEQEAFEMPWGSIAWGGLLLVFALISALYGVKWWRRLRPMVAAGAAEERAVFVATLDRLSDMGLSRDFGETRERYALRLAAVAPSMAALTRAHLSTSLGRPGRRHPEVRESARAVAEELRKNIPLGKRILGALNPVGWWFTR